MPNCDLIIDLPVLASSMFDGLISGLSGYCHGNHFKKVNLFILVLAVKVLISLLPKWFFGHFLLSCIINEIWQTSYLITHYDSDNTNPLLTVDMINELENKICVNLSTHHCIFWLPGIVIDAGTCPCTVMSYQLMGVPHHYDSNEIMLLIYTLGLIKAIHQRPNINLCYGLT